tara:strand:- start:109 stop:429 length:321 start_codon:yes stop_codon:yes gene_type:complete
MKIKIIQTTTDNKKTANFLAEYLVKEKLSPCIHILPNIQSIYNWKGKLVTSYDLLVVIKTIPKKVQKCKDIILKYHNYDIPELIISDGEILNEDYKIWFVDTINKL